MFELLNYELLRTNSLVITVGSILSVFLVLAATYIALKLFSAMLRRSMRQRAVSEGRQASFLQLVSYFVWTFGLIVAVQSLGLNITFLVASSAALMVGIGLGLQNVFKDFISGIIILLDGTVKAEDVVEIGGWVVKVKEVSLRSSSVLTREDNIVIIPNHKFIEENVINWTHNATPSRFELNVGVDYASDIDQIEQVLLEVVGKRDDILYAPQYTPFIRLMNFGSSSLDFQVIFWSNNMFRIETTKSQIRFDIVRAFHKNGITIPFTQVVLHQAQTKGSA